MGVSFRLETTMRPGATRKQWVFGVTVPFEDEPEALDLLARLSELTSLRPIADRLRRGRNPSHEFYVAGDGDWPPDLLGFGIHTLRCRLIGEGWQDRSFA